MSLPSVTRRPFAQSSSIFLTCRPDSPAKTQLFVSPAKLPFDQARLFHVCSPQVSRHISFGNRASHSVPLPPPPTSVMVSSVRLPGRSPLLLTVLFTSLSPSAGRLQLRPRPRASKFIDARAEVVATLDTASRSLDRDVVTEAFVPG